MPLRYGRAPDTTEPNQKEDKIMNVWHPNPGYHPRQTLTGAVVGAWALIASPAPVLAAGTFPGFLCNPDLVAVFPGKFISVHCTPGDGAIAWFALGIVNPDSSRVLSLAATAVAARRTLSITYDPNDHSGPAFGCEVQFACLPLQGVMMNRD
jgi:hypothetical protein